MLQEWQTGVRWTDKYCIANLHCLTVNKFRQSVFTYGDEGRVKTEFLQDVSQEMVFEWQYHVAGKKRICLELLDFCTVKAAR